MEIKAELLKPYKENEKRDFIISQNHRLGYEVRETELALQAWGYSQEELLEQAKESKKAEALSKANEYINNGEALFEFEENKHIEATDGNIGKFTAYLIGFEKEIYETVRWNTKEDENVELNAEQVAYILQGLANVQSYVWTWKYPVFLKSIEFAKTVEEVEKIKIDYSKSRSSEIEKEVENEIKD
mgnify:CR=1 FL=1